MTLLQANSHARLQAITGPSRHSCSEPSEAHLWTIDYADLQQMLMNYFADSNLSLPSPDSAMGALGAPPIIIINQ